MRFCIVGSGRCGSTLIRRIFNSLPDVFVFNETHWIPNLVAHAEDGLIDVAKGLEVIRNTNHVTGLSVSDLSEISDYLNEMERGELTVRELCDTVGNAFAELNGKTVWADKTPDYGEYMPLIQSLWPECKFIHVIRNGVDAAASMSGHPGYQVLAATGASNWVSLSHRYQPGSSGTSAKREDYVRLWVNRLRATQTASQKLSKNTYLEVRYENLLSFPEKTIREMCAFLGLSYEPAWLDSAQSMVDPNRLSRRKSDFDLSFDAAGRELMAELDYRLDS